MEQFPNQETEPREKCPEVAALVEKAWRDEVPQANKHGANQYGSRGTRATAEHGSNQHSSTSGDCGTRSTNPMESDGILARLKRDDPDHHATMAG